MQKRSAVALATLALMVGIIYFGQFLPNGRAGLLMEHPHDAVTCQTCHSGSFGGGESHDLGANNQVCSGCHASVSTSKSVFHFGSDGEQCSRCHSFHKPELVRAADDTMLLAFAEKAVLVCEDCHKEGGRMPEVSVGHREAASLIHSQRSEIFAQSPSEFCLSCHDVARSANLETRSALTAPRFHVSASHVFGQVVVAGSVKPGSTLKIQDQLPQHLKLINGKTECQTCHSLNSKNDYLLSQRIEDGLCTSCHDMQREAISSPIFTVNPQ